LENKRKDLAEKRKAFKVKSDAGLREVDANDPVILSNKIKGLNVKIET